MTVTSKGEATFALTDLQAFQISLVIQLHMERQVQIGRSSRGGKSGMASFPSRSVPIGIESAIPSVSSSQTREIATGPATVDHSGVELANFRFDFL